MSTPVSSTSLGPQILEILGVKADVVTEFHIHFVAGELVNCSITRILTIEEGQQISNVLESYTLSRLEDSDSENCDYD